MNHAKIRLSQAEMELVTNADLILTKNTILKKVNQLLGQLQEEQKQILFSHSNALPEKVLESSPKISKGENYLGLPYQILDCPRVFEHEILSDRQAGIFAIRTMFWWGNFFSVTLHLSGIYKKQAEEKLVACFDAMKEKGYYCYINDDPWKHHFEDHNYILLSDIKKTDFERSVKEKSFFKMANKISLQQWTDAEKILIRYFKELIIMMVN